LVCTIYHFIWVHLNSVLHKSIPSLCLFVSISPYRCYWSGTAR
jgi:hypothetical protein